MHDLLVYTFTIHLCVLSQHDNAPVTNLAVHLTPDNGFLSCALHCHNAAVPTAAQIISAAWIISAACIPNFAMKAMIQRVQCLCYKNISLIILQLLYMVFHFAGGSMASRLSCCSTLHSLLVHSV